MRSPRSFLYEKGKGISNNSSAVHTHKNRRLTGFDSRSSVEVAKSLTSSHWCSALAALHSDGGAAAADRAAAAVLLAGCLQVLQCSDALADVANGAKDLNHLEGRVILLDSAGSLAGRMRGDVLEHKPLRLRQAVHLDALDQQAVDRLVADEILDEAVKVSRADKRLIGARRVDLRKDNILHLLCGEEVCLRALVQQSNRATLLQQLAYILLGIHGGAQHRGHGSEAVAVGAAALLHKRLHVALQHKRSLQEELEGLHALVRLHLGHHAELRAQNKLPRLAQPGNLPQFRNACKLLQDVREVADRAVVLEDVEHAGPQLDVVDLVVEADLGDNAHSRRLVAVVAPEAAHQALL
eukprot:m.138495 g.138495  ORF g.138495 m.138495 type:complete len:353 (+) comp16631_c0_seq1:2245-3303(+)